METGFLLNEQNLGLVGNYLKGITVSKSLFYWGIGDDDALDSLLIRKVIEQIRKNITQNVTIIHLNHRCVDGITANVIHEKIYEPFLDDTLIQGTKGIQILVESRHSGGFMFITANILHTQLAADFILSVLRIEFKRLMLQN